MSVVKIIGVPALLEQCAEECTELAQACLKMARKLRDDNPTPKTTEEIINNLNEEIADVTICMDEIAETGIVSHESIESVMLYKRDRWRKRLNEKGE